VTATGLGILLNNEMDDSRLPGEPNMYGLVQASETPSRRANARFRR
jgi:hypothetical protein